MAAVIDLLRHGETGRAGFRGSVNDTLNHLGLTQMRAAVVTEGPWDAVVTSPLARCAAFARELARSRGAPLLVDERLRELHFGEWEGQHPRRLMRTEPEALAAFWADPYAHPPPGGESLDAFEERVLGALDALTRQHSGERLLMITHGGVIRVILRHTRSLPPSALLHIEVPHASLHRVVLPPGDRQISCAAS